MVDEYNELNELLESVQRKAAAPRRGRVRSGSPAPRRGGGRARQALELVEAEPGITVAELASRMEIGPTYLYKLLPDLEREGRVRKVGRGYEPVTTTAPPPRSATS